MQFTLDPNPTRSMPVGRHHNQRSSDLDRRHLLKLGFATIAAASLPGRQFKRNPRRNPAHRQSRRTTQPPMAGYARIRSPGSIRTGITTKARRRMLSYPTSSTSMASWLAATASTAWVRTIKATALPGEIPPPTTAIWQANTGQDVRHGREYLPIHDLRFSRDRRSLQTSFMTFILPFHLKGCIGSRRYQQTASRSARTEQRPRCR